MEKNPSWESSIDAQSLVDYYIENVIGKVATFEEKRDALREAVSFIIHIDNARERDLFIKRVSEKVRFKSGTSNKRGQSCLESA